jgi:trans-aconitate 2-methyltransferase
MSTPWNPAQYDKFKTQRSKPFFDLMALVQNAPFNDAVDLGCGTGELTRALFERLRPKRLTGIDSSAEMLAKADAGGLAGLSFERKDILAYEPGAPLDLVFSNAALHWLPDHERLFPRLLGWVRPGGQVAIQMPFNFDHPSHRVARAVATRLFPAEFSGEGRVSGTLPQERYAELLFEHGFGEQLCRVEVYGHPMASGNDVVEWNKGSLLTAYQERLAAPDFERFVQAYREALLAEIGAQPYFYAFKRLLLWGRKTL